MGRTIYTHREIFFHFVDITFISVSLLVRKVIISYVHLWLWPQGINLTECRSSIINLSIYIQKPWAVISLCFATTTVLGILLKASVFRLLQSHGLVGQLKLFKWQDTLEDLLRSRLGSLKANILFSQQGPLMMFIEWLVHQSWGRFSQSVRYKPFKIWITTIQFKKENQNDVFKWN